MKNMTMEELKAEIFKRMAVNLKKAEETGSEVKRGRYNEDRSILRMLGMRSEEINEEEKSWWII